MKLEAVGGIDPTVRAALEGCGIATTDDLWRSIGASFAEGIERTAATAGVAEDEIVAVLTGELLASGPAGRRLTLKDLILALAVLALATLVGYRIVEALGGPRIGFLSPESRQAVVARDSLPALHLIENADLQMGPSETGIATPELVVGRRLLRPLSKGDVVMKSHLAPEGMAPDALLGTVVLELALSKRVGEIRAAPGSRVQLLFSPTAEGQEELEQSALILAVTPAGEDRVLTVAVPADRVGALTRVLAASEITLAYPCCPEGTAGKAP